MILWLLVSLTAGLFIYWVGYLISRYALDRLIKRAEAARNQAMALVDEAREMAVGAESTTAELRKEFAAISARMKIMEGWRKEDTSTEQPD